MRARKEDPPLPLPLPPALPEAPWRDCSFCCVEALDVVVVDANGEAAVVDKGRRLVAFEARMLPPVGAVVEPGPFAGLAAVPCDVALLGLVAGVAGVAAVRVVAGDLPRCIGWRALVLVGSCVACVAGFAAVRGWLVLVVAEVVVAVVEGRGFLGLVLVRVAAEEAVVLLVAAVALDGGSFSWPLDLALVAAEVDATGLRAAGVACAPLLLLLFVVESLLVVGFLPAALAVVAVADDAVVLLVFLTWVVDAGFATVVFSLGAGLDLAAVVLVVEEAGAALALVA